jgi:hypothetical protein
MVKSGFLDLSYILFPPLDYLLLCLFSMFWFLCGGSENINVSTILNYITCSNEKYINNFNVILIVKTET